jgi:hypothetical protein
MAFSLPSIFEVGISRRELHIETLPRGLLEEVVIPNPLSTSWRCFERALDDFMQAQLVAA